MTKHCLCNSCNRTFLLGPDPGAGQCPYCGSLEVEVVGNTPEDPDTPMMGPLPAPVSPSPAPLRPGPIRGAVPETWGDEDIWAWTDYWEKRL